MAPKDDVSAEYRDSAAPAWITIRRGDQSGQCAMALS